MKTRITLKALSDLPSEAHPIPDAPLPVFLESPPQPDDPKVEDFREMMQRRYTTPFPIQHGGRNE